MLNTLIGCPNTKSHAQAHSMMALYASGLSNQVKNKIHCSLMWPSYWEVFPVFPSFLYWDPCQQPLTRIVEGCWLTLRIGTFVSNILQRSQLGLAMRRFLLMRIDAHQMRMWSFWDASDLSGTYGSQVINVWKKYFFLATFWRPLNLTALWDMHRFWNKFQRNHLNFS